MSTTQVTRAGVHTACGLGKMSYDLQYKKIEIENWIKHIHIDTTQRELKQGTIVRTCQLKVMTNKCKRHYKTLLRSKEDDKEVKRGFDGKMLTLFEKYCLRESEVGTGPLHLQHNIHYSWVEYPDIGQVTSDSGLVCPRHVLQL